MIKQKRWQRDMEKFERDCGRLYPIEAADNRHIAEFYLIRGNDPDFANGLMLGDPKTLRFAECISKFFIALNDPKQWNSSHLPLCLTCDYVFQRGELPPAVVLALPWGKNWVEKGGYMVASGICPDCATISDEEVCAKAAERWQAQVLPTGSA